jgi:hypothetical protein
MVIVMSIATGFQDTAPAPVIATFCPEATTFSSSFILTEVYCEVALVEFDMASATLTIDVPVVPAAPDADLVLELEPLHAARPAMARTAVAAARVRV